MSAAHIAHIERFSAAVAAGDGPAFAALFTADATYDDVFYGPFHGREAIARMLADLWHRDGRDFVWEMQDPIGDADRVYVNWQFSFTSKKPETAGRRAVMRGASLFTFEGGLIASYREWCDGGATLIGIGVPATVVGRVLGQRDAALRARLDPGRHHNP